MIESDPLVPAVPNAGRLVGVDHGKARIGLAICDLEQRIASPLELYIRKHPAADASYFSKLAQTHQVVGWVVGMPYLASGDESEQSAIVREFANWLNKVTQLPYRFHDERFTTVAAEEWLQFAGLKPEDRKQKRDQVAAQLLLQAYLDEQIQQHRC